MNYLLMNLFLILVYIYYLSKMKRGFHILQLESYRNERYIRWIKENTKEVIKIKELLLFIPIILIYINIIIAFIIGIILAITLYFIRDIYKEKKPLVVTKRVKRLYISSTIIYILLTIISNISLLINNHYILAITMIIINILIITSTYFIILVNKINMPIENKINKGFYNRAKKKLQEMHHIKVIGITGSYGKTSTKYILKGVLEQKYNVLMTPESFNTTLGVVRTINEKLNATHEIFICEMGAKNIGDIKEICDLVKPEYGILTAIGPQHLETFKTLDNVRKTKMELVDAIINKVFINYDDENIRNTKVEKENVKYGLNKDCNIYAYNIKITEDGSVFDVHTKNGDIKDIKTKLLGEHNILNILAAISLAQELNLTTEQIKLGIRLIKPVPHRLELRKNPNGLIIIDDAYNSNIRGATKALETLKLFKNKNRVFVTPGIVELGNYREKYNKELGKKATTCADYIILVGEKHTKYIYEKVIEEKYPKDKVFIAKDLEEAINKWNEFKPNETVVLLENDLPDNYL